MKFDRRELVYFSGAKQALNEEVLKHPELRALLVNHPAEEFEVRLAEIAKYSGVMLDGTYDAQDIDNICELCLGELQKKKESVIVLLPTH